MPAPSSSEMTGTLMEFHQRNQGLIKPVGPPPPFEITSVVQQPQPVVWPSRRKVEDDPIVQQSALVRPETEFDFIPNNYTFSASILQCYLDWFFKCHNEGTVGFESYIRVYPGSFWRSITPPGYTGPVGLFFNPTTWTPPASNEQGALVNLTINIYNVPDPARFPMHEAHIYFFVYIEMVDPPHTLSDTIHPIGTVLNWNWYYGVAHGIGFDLVFHTPGP